jgi:hypothetical protein
MKYIAFDAAKKRTGWAYRGVNVPWVTGVVCPDDTVRLGEIIAAAKRAGVVAAVIENCYLGARNDEKRNIHTLKMLQDAQTRIVLACEMNGLNEPKPKLVYPVTWQAAFQIGGRRDDRKLGARRVAKDLGAPELVFDDEADAVCRCVYAESLGRQDELALCGPRGGKFRCGRGRR